MLYLQKYWFLAVVRNSSMKPLNRADLALPKLRAWYF